MLVKATHVETYLDTCLTFWQLCPGTYLHGRQPDPQLRRQRPGNKAVRLRVPTGLGDHTAPKWDAPVLQSTFCY